MRHLSMIPALVALAILAGCQSVALTNKAVPGKDYTGRCFHRPNAAGFCEQPSNFLIMDYLFGPR